MYVYGQNKTIKTEVKAHVHLWVKSKIVFTPWLYGVFLLVLWRTLHEPSNGLGLKSRNLYSFNCGFRSSFNRFPCVDQSATRS